jgi:indolepyruvate ferredoxin oxidoreductase
MSTETRTRPLSSLQDYQLDDALWAGGGRVFLNGTQALVRLLLIQRHRDAPPGLDTRG